MLLDIEVMDDASDIRSKSQKKEKKSAPESQSRQDNNFSSSSTKIKTLEERVSDLELLCARLSHQISALQKSDQDETTKTANSADKSPPMPPTIKDIAKKPKGVAPSRYPSRNINRTRPPPALQTISSSETESDELQFDD